MIKFLPTIDAPANTKLPQRSTQFSAGYDFYAPKDIFIPAGGESVLIPLNIKAIMPGDMVLMLFIRSSLAVKFNLSLVNSVGIIDSDYANNQDNDGNIGVKFRNNGSETIIIREGERCALIFLYQRSIICRHLRKLTQTIWLPTESITITG